MSASTGADEYTGRLSNLLQELAPRDGPAARLHVVTLGHFALFLAGEHIGSARWNRPKVQKLFKYLLTADGRQPAHPSHNAPRRPWSAPVRATRAAPLTGRSAAFGVVEEP